MQATPLLEQEFDGLRIGLFGGSFNPAHEGHLMMSAYACERLSLDEIWWLVSPLNPLKESNEMQGFAARYESAKTIAAPHKNFRVTMIENELGTRFTIDTLRAIKTRWPRTKFVWLMGEDNWQSFHLWRSWEEILCELPIAVFRRSGYCDSREENRAAAKFAKAEFFLASAEHLADQKPPAWVVLDNPLSPLSATQIRKSSQPT